MNRLLFALALLRNRLATVKAELAVSRDRSEERIARNEELRQINIALQAERDDLRARLEAVEEGS